MLDVGGYLVDNYDVDDDNVDLMKMMVVTDCNEPNHRWLNKPVCYLFLLIKRKRNTFILARFHANVKLICLFVSLKSGFLHCHEGHRSFSHNGHRDLPNFQWKGGEFHQLIRGNGHEHITHR